MANQIIRIWGLLALLVALGTAACAPMTPQELQDLRAQRATVSGFNLQTDRGIVAQQGQSISPEQCRAMGGTPHPYGVQGTNLQQGFSGGVTNTMFIICLPQGQQPPTLAELQRMMQQGQHHGRPNWYQRRQQHYGGGYGYHRPPHGPYPSIELVGPLPRVSLEWRSSRY